MHQLTPDRPHDCLHNLVVVALLPDRRSRARSFVTGGMHAERVDRQQIHSSLVDAYTAAGVPAGGQMQLVCYGRSGVAVAGKLTVALAPRSS